MILLVIVKGVWYMLLPARFPLLQETKQLAGCIYQVFRQAAQIPDPGFNPRRAFGQNDYRIGTE
jgi:hypothetical protein